MFEKKTKSKTKTAPRPKSSKIGKKTSKTVKVNTIKSMFEKKKPVKRPATDIPMIDIDPSKVESLSFSEITCHFCSEKILFCQIDPHYEHCLYFKQLSKLKK